MTINNGRTSVTSQSNQPVILAEDDSNSDDSECQGYSSNINTKMKKNTNTQSSSKKGKNTKETYTFPEVNTNEPTATTTFLSDGCYRNKQRVLTLSSRNISSRHRHLLEDLRALLPHHKRENKLDVGKNSPHDGIRQAVNEIAEIRGTNTILFLESRKCGNDAYLWIGRSSGPSARFLVENIHTMHELKLTGNSLKGSRPFLVFDSSFEKIKHLQVMKCLFLDIFGTPRGHPKSKPFIDRSMSFFYLDNKIWVRNYQIQEKAPTNAKEATNAKKKHGKSVVTALIEIGPRFVLNPIRIFRGSLGGQTLYHNDKYVSPNDERALTKARKGQVYTDRKKAQRIRTERRDNIVLPQDPLADVFKE